MSLYAPERSASLANATCRHQREDDRVAHTGIGVGDPSRSLVMLTEGQRNDIECYTLISYHSTGLLSTYSCPQSK
jgi:hypothetical protein